MADITPRSRPDLETGRTRSAAWGAPFFLGLVISALGIFAFIAAGITSLATILFFGALLAVGGIFEIIEGFRHRKHGSLMLHLLSGILALVVGGIMLFRPLAGLAAISLMLGGYFVASGLFRGITAVADRYERWGFDLFYAVVAIALGVIVFSGWPISSLWLVGALVGAELIARGIAIMGVSLSLRHELKSAAV